jgi:septal ring-binding cell division protein DamX
MPASFSGGGGTSSALNNATVTGTLKSGNYHLEPIEYDAGNSSTTITIDWANGSAQKVTMTGNCTFTLSNPVVGAAYILKLVQDATGGRTYTWPAAVKWPAATSPTGSAATKTDLISLYYDGTSYFGTYATNF